MFDSPEPEQAVGMGWISIQGRIKGLAVNDRILLVADQQLCDEDKGKRTYGGSLGNSVNERTERVSFEACVTGHVPSNFSLNSPERRILFSRSGKMEGNITRDSHAPDYLNYLIG